MQFTNIILKGLTSGKVINPNIIYNILRTSFATLFTFQGLLLHSFDRDYITTKSILSKEQDVFKKEIGHILNCTLSKKGNTPSSDFKTINVMYFFCYSIKHLS